MHSAFVILCSEEYIENELNLYDVENKLKKIMCEDNNIVSRGYVGDWLGNQLDTDKAILGISRVYQDMVSMIKFNLDTHKVFITKDSNTLLNRYIYNKVKAKLEYLEKENKIDQNSYFCIKEEIVPYGEIKFYIPEYNDIYDIFELIDYGIGGYSEAVIVAVYDYHF